MTYQYIPTYLRIDGLTLETCPRNIRADAECVLVAIAQNVRAIEFASKKLLQNREFLVRALLQTGGGIYPLLGAENMQDPKLAMLALKLDESCFHLLPKEVFTPEFCQSIIEYLIVSLSGQGRDIKGACKSWEEQLDKSLEPQIVFKGVEQPDYILSKIRTLQPKLLDNKALAGVLFEHDPYCIEILDKKMLQDTEFVEPYILKHPQILQNFPNSVRSNKELAMRIFESLEEDDVFLISNFSATLRADKDVVLACIARGSGGVLSWPDVSQDLQKDKQVLHTLCLQQGLWENEYMAEHVFKGTTQELRQEIGFEEALQEARANNTYGSIGNNAVCVQVFKKVLDKYFKETLCIFDTQRKLDGAIKSTSENLDGSAKKKKLKL